MPPFDFRQIPNDAPLPYTSSPYFLFFVHNETKARVNPARGINCGFDALLQLNGQANAIELIVSNDAGTATITAWLTGPNGLQIGPNKSVPSKAGLQTVRFDETNIVRITFESRGELYLETVS
jgi:hypothetical protein